MLARVVADLAGAQSRAAADDLPAGYRQTLGGDRRRGRAVADAAGAIEAVAPPLASDALAVGALPAQLRAAVQFCAVGARVAALVGRALDPGDGAERRPALAAVAVALVVPHAVAAVVAVPAVALEAAVRPVVAGRARAGSGFADRQQLQCRFGSARVPASLVDDSSVVCVAPAVPAAADAQVYVPTQAATPT